MNSSVWQFQPDLVQDWAYMDNMFTPEECKQIIAIGNQKLQKATTFNNAKIRESQIAWLFGGDERLEFVFRRVTDAVLSLNSQFFQFDLFGMAEGFQFTRYDAPSGYYGLHVDRALNGVVRKLSLTIQLSSPEDYEGGDLLLRFSENADVMPKELGKMVVFPSYVLHEVRPVTKGTRYSLVAWITGKPFK